MKSFLSLFQTVKPAIIAEVKFASPTHPALYPGQLNHLQIAKSYLENGADALSILTENTCFKGNIRYLSEIREAYPKALLLQKDFITHKAQITQSKACGADAILLMAKILTPFQLRSLFDTAMSLDLCPLLEVQNQKELAVALTFKPPLIGINNRNMTTLTIDLATSHTLIPKIPSNIPVVCESGIQSGKQIRELSALGFRGFLIGSTLMKDPVPGQALIKLLGDFYEN